MIDFDGCRGAKGFFRFAAEGFASPEQESRAEPFAAPDRIGADSVLKALRKNCGRERILRDETVDSRRHLLQSILER